MPPFTGINPGDCVELKTARSGLIQMVVDEIIVDQTKGRLARCIWFNGNVEIVWANMPLHVLRKVKGGSK